MEMLAKITTGSTGRQARVTIEKIEYSEGTGAIPVATWGVPWKLWTNPDDGTRQMVPRSWDSSTYGEKVIVSRVVWDKSWYSYWRKRSRAVVLTQNYFDGITDLMTVANVNPNIPSTRNNKENRNPGIHILNQTFIRGTSTRKLYRSYLTAEYKNKPVWTFGATDFSYDNEDHLFEDLRLARLALGDLLIAEGKLENFDRDLDWPRDREGEVNVVVLDPDAPVPSPGGTG